uniref:Uncharacterized protein n=1 Tax=Ciona intestinalis TaxID=7719 RepID=H2XMU0_CIOIN
MWGHHHLGRIRGHRSGSHTLCSCRVRGTCRIHHNLGCWNNTETIFAARIVSGTHRAFRTRSKWSNCFILVRRQET